MVEKGDSELNRWLPGWLEKKVQAKAMRAPTGKAEIAPVSIRLSHKGT